MQLPYTNSVISYCVVCACTYLPATLIIKSIAGVPMHDAADRSVIVYYVDVQFSIMPVSHFHLIILFGLTLNLSLR